MDRHLRAPLAISLLVHMALLLLLPHWLGPLAAIVTVPARSTVRRVVVVDIADRAADFASSTLALAGGRGEAFGGPEADPRRTRSTPAAPEAPPAAVPSRAGAPQASPEPDPVQPRRELSALPPTVMDEAASPTAPVSPAVRRDPGQPVAAPESAPVTAPAAPSATLAPADPVPAEPVRADPEPARPAPSVPVPAQRTPADAAPAERALADPAPAEPGRPEGLPHIADHTLPAGATPLAAAVPSLATPFPPVRAGREEGEASPNGSRSEPAAPSPTRRADQPETVALREAAISVATAPSRDAGAAQELPPSPLPVRPAAVPQGAPAVPPPAAPVPSPVEPPRPLPPSDGSPVAPVSVAPAASPLGSADAPPVALPAARPGEAPAPGSEAVPAARAVDAPVPGGGRGLLSPPAEQAPEAPAATVGPLPFYQLGDGLSPQDTSGRDVFVIDPVQPTRPEANPSFDVAPVPDDKARLAPVPLTPLTVPYPEALKGSGVEGYVQVRVWLDPEGQVTRWEVANVRGGEAFVQAVAEAVEQWRFRVHPAWSLAGRQPPVVVVPVRFSEREEQ